MRPAGGRGHNGSLKPFQALTHEALLARFTFSMNEGSTSVSGHAVAEQVDGQRPSRASFTQRSMWAAAQRHPGVPFNVVVVAWRIQDPVQTDLLEAALVDLSARHPTLRARLVVEGGQLLQVVSAPGPVSFSFTDLRDATTECQLTTAAGLLREEGRTVMDMATGPLFKARLLRLGETDHILCFYLHHAVCDAWSVQILIRDLSALYGARARAQPVQLPALPEQYGDFAAAQFQTFESGGYAAEIAYWRDELADAPAPLELPTPAPRKRNRDYRCESPTRAESALVMGAIRTFARQQRVSVFAVLLASLAVLLHQRTQREDFLIGVSTQNRWSPQSLLFVGCTTNLLPARIRMGQATGFGDLCRQIHSTLRRLVAFGRIPLELLQRELGENSVARLALPIWCQFRQAIAVSTIDSAGLSLTPFTMDRTTTLVCELELDLVEFGGALVSEFAHRVALFTPELMADLMADFGAVVRTVPSDPNLLVGDLCRLISKPRA
jgi:hypothetical protein